MNQKKVNPQDALDYHSSGRPGKIEVIPTKACYTARDLALAYSPGVAEVSKIITKQQNEVYKYTAKGNLVAVISNGTAVLGLGNIGPYAAKPVMEGKGILFKRFADIDVFDIEINSKDTKEIINAIKVLEPTFGGINLEDIKAPECFEIEEELQKIMNIPVFHDDQHGTAIISCAALLNSVEITKRKLDEIRIIVNGAGAAAISCCRLYVKAGVKKENIFMFDTKGLIHKDRTDLNKYKAEFANENLFKSLEDALQGADVFVGLSVANILTPEMIKKMAPEPIIFALANPDPEINYDLAKEAVPDAIVATGRSDFKNQVNNVLGFPFIFRGALDVRATKINEEMKIAAVKAIADLAKEEVPDIVIRAYGGEKFEFGKDYIIPKPFDPRVLWYVAPAVAKAAIESGVAQKIITDWDRYVVELKERLGYTKEAIRIITQKASRTPKKVIYPEGESVNIILAASEVYNDGIAYPILIGRKDKIIETSKKLSVDYKKFQIIDVTKKENFDKYADEIYKIRQRKGVSYNKAKELLNNNNYLGMAMLKLGEADALISGYERNYPDTIRPALQIIGLKEGVNVVSGMYIIVTKNDIYFFADTTINKNPTPQQLAEIAILTADTVRDFDITPKVAMLSYSNFGSVRDEQTEKVRLATEIVKKVRPDIIIDGEMQLDTAVNHTIIENYYPFSSLKEKANVLIFPDLNSGNIAYKLMLEFDGATLIGPILTGLKKSVHVIQNGACVEDIINITSIAVIEAK
jgi:malate dehydrogenase (oxaloacetate-decarboxylating)(NADP+)